PGLASSSRFGISAIINGLAFGGIGVVKGIVLRHGLFRSSLHTLVTGGGAAALAFGVSYWLRTSFVP
ncbi:MAG: hypothetical protein ACOCW2_00940, partial [Chitinivibrionales bacterium]